MILNRRLCFNPISASYKASEVCWQSILEFPQHLRMTRIQSNHPSILKWHPIYQSIHSSILKWYPIHQCIHPFILKWYTLHPAIHPSIVPISIICTKKFLVKCMFLVSPKMISNRYVDSFAPYMTPLHDVYKNNVEYIFSFNSCLSLSPLTNHQIFNYAGFDQFHI